MRPSQNSCCNTPFRPAWATTTFGTPERALKLTAEPARKANCTTFPVVVDALGENDYALLSHYCHHSCLTSSSAACALTCTVSSASTAWTFAVSAFARGLPISALRRYCIVIPQAFGRSFQSHYYFSPFCVLLFSPTCPPPPLFSFLSFHEVVVVFFCVVIQLQH